MTEGPVAQEVEKGALYILGHLSGEWGGGFRTQKKFRPLRASLHRLEVMMRWYPGGSEQRETPNKRSLDGVPTCPPQTAGNAHSFGVVRERVERKPEALPAVSYHLFPAFLPLGPPLESGQSW